MKHGIPVVHASIFRFEGQMTVFKPYEGPCYRCLFPEPPPPELAPSCAEGGVLGVLPGIMGTLQATEALKLLLEHRRAAGRPAAAGRRAARRASTRSRCAAIPNCPVCGEHAGQITYIDYEQFCAGGNRVARALRGTRCAVTLRMPPILRPQVGGAREVAATGDTLSEVLDDLFAQFPSVREQILDADGDLNRSSTSTSRTRTSASARASRPPSRTARP